MPFGVEHLAGSAVLDWEALAGHTFDAFWR